MNEEYIDNVKHLIEQKDADKVKGLLIDLHPADIAELCNDLNPEEAKFIYRLLDNEIAADVLVEMDEDARKELLEMLPSETIAKRFVDYMIYGGLPQIVSFQSERQKADYLKNIFANVYLKDVIERNKIQNVDEIGILVDVLASAIGAPTNPSKIANTFASERQMTYANKTISKHIDHLTDAFLISKASRYDIKGRKYIGANLKYYFTDLGLRNARLNFRQQEPTHIMENIVYNELLIRGYNVDVGVVDIFDKDKEGKRVRKQLEVDFVVNQGNQRYYIQVAYDMTSEEKQTQEFNSLRNIPDSFKKIVIVNGSKKPWRNDEGFVIMGMKYFLLNANSLEF